MPDEWPAIEPRLRHIKYLVSLSYCRMLDLTTGHRDIKKQGTTLLLRLKITMVCFRTTD